LANAARGNRPQHFLLYRTAGCLAATIDAPHLSAQPKIDRCRHPGAKTEASTIRIGAKGIEAVAFIADRSGGAAAIEIREALSL
jgi:hypothetical protein